MRYVRRVILRNISLHKPQQRVSSSQVSLYLSSAYSLKTIRCKIRNIRQQTAGEMTYNCHEMEQLICKEDLNPINLSSSSLYLWRAFGVPGISGGTDIHCSGCFCPNDAVLLHDISKLLKLSQENPSPQA